MYEIIGSQPFIFSAPDWILSNMSKQVEGRARGGGKFKKFLICLVEFMQYGRCVGMQRMLGYRITFLIEKKGIKKQISYVLNKKNKINEFGFKKSVAFNELRFL